uniref:Niban 1/2/3 domain-containing protein n=1 Tax=Amphilophus citrinellus TaxID=61819 RepID=A0A3Q0QPR8_AMPCI
SVSCRGNMMCTCFCVYPGLADSTFQSFSAFYRQQYSVAYLGHLHQEVEPKREGRVQREHSQTHICNVVAVFVFPGVKEDSSSLVFNPDAFAVHLHLPYRGHTCFLFHQEEERDHFLSSLKTCIRHRNLGKTRTRSFSLQAYTRALRLYRQEKGCYESWEMLLGTEEQVLASQVIEEVLPWLQSQLQSRLKGKKTERIRLWLTAQATYTMVLETLTAGLEALKEECRQTASNNQALIRSNLDQIMSSHSFLEQKVRACVCEEAEKVCSESVAPYMSSILEALTENISAGILGMQRTLHAQMDSFAGFSPNVPTCSDRSYKQVENLTEKLEGLKDRFGLSSTHRLVQSLLFWSSCRTVFVLQLLDSAVYTLEQFLQSSSRLQPSQVPVKLNRATERVLKQLDYDSRVVQRRLYEEALLEITLPTLTRKMDSKWKTVGRPHCCCAPSHSVIGLVMLTLLPFMSGFSVCRSCNSSSSTFSLTTAVSSWFITSTMMF